MQKLHLLNFFHMKWKRKFQGKIYQFFIKTYQINQAIIWKCFISIANHCFLKKKKIKKFSSIDELSMGTWVKYLCVVASLNFFLSKCKLWEKLLWFPLFGVNRTKSYLLLLASDFWMIWFLLWVESIRILNEQFLGFLMKSNSEKKIFCLNKRFFLHLVLFFWALPCFCSLNRTFGKKIKKNGRCLKKKQWKCKSQNPADRFAWGPNDRLNIYWRPKYFIYNKIASADLEKLNSCLRHFFKKSRNFIFFSNFRFFSHIRDLFYYLTYLIQYHIYNHIYL